MWAPWGWLPIGTSSISFPTTWTDVPDADLRTGCLSGECGQANPAGKRCTDEITYIAGKKLLITSRKMLDVRLTAIWIFLFFVLNTAIMLGLSKSNPVAAPRLKVRPLGWGLRYVQTVMPSGIADFEIADYWSRHRADPSKLGFETCAASQFRLWSDVLAAFQNRFWDVA